MPDFLTTAQVAELLGVSDDTVGRLALAGTLPEAQKLPGRTGARIFERETVETYIAAKQAAMKEAS